MLWWIIGVHYIWSIGLWQQPSILTKLVALIGLDWVVQLGLSANVMAIFLFTISTMAALGLVIEPNLRRRISRSRGLILMSICLIPQYLVVLIAFGSDLNTILSSSFHGMHVERWVLLCALWPVAWGAILHTGAILEHYAIGLSSEVCPTCGRPLY